jgi:hypothetical protein
MLLCCKWGLSSLLQSMSPWLPLLGSAQPRSIGMSRLTDCLHCRARCNCRSSRTCHTCLSHSPPTPASEGDNSRLPHCQANIVSVIADCLPKGATIDSRLMEEHFVPKMMSPDCMGNLHCARARAAVLGCLARGVKLRDSEGGRRIVEMQPDRMLKDLLEELCKGPSRSACPSLAVCNCPCPGAPTSQALVSCACCGSGDGVCCVRHGQQRPFLRGAVGAPGGALSAVQHVVRAATGAGLERRSRLGATAPAANAHTVCVGTMGGRLIVRLAALLRRRAGGLAGQPC